MNRTTVNIGLATSLAMVILGCPAEPTKPQQPAKGVGSKPVAAASQPGAAAAGPQKLVVYSGRSEALVGPILEAFDQAHPEIQLDIRYNKTPALAGQVLAEGAECPADVIWFQDSGYLGALAEAKILARLPEPILNRADARFRDPNGRWVGVTGRLRVLVYSTAKLKPDTLPNSLADLADPMWKGKLGWAPGNASFQAHVSALRHLWGEAKTKAWLLAVKANEPARYPKNSPQVKAAASGEIQIGWVNHYYLHKLKRDGFAAANHSFPAEGDGGNILMLAGAGIREGSPRVDAATKLLEYLLDKQTQGRFATGSFEYPVVAGVATHPDVTPMADLKLATVDQRHLADIKPTLALLRELGIE